MVIRLSHLFLRTLREDPVDAEIASHKLLIRAGYIRRTAPGIYTWLPLGLKVLAKLEAIIREEMQAIGAQEVHFPALLPREPYEASGRWTEYGDGIFRLKDRKANDYLLAPTHEEMFTLLVKDMYSSYKDLPVTLYQIQTKYRDEARPRAGLLRGREFIMKDSYSFDIDDAGLEVSYQAHRDAYFRIFDRLGLEVVAVKATGGAMGGSKTEEFQHPTPVGEDTFVRSPGGYTANAEAVTTLVPETINYANFPAAEVKDTPDTPTIETLVAAANQLSPKAEGSWGAADTLKNVVLAIEIPLAAEDDNDEVRVERRVVIIGVPGDRDVDVKRIGATIAPHLGLSGELEVEAATEEDLKAHPELVKGYIGPGLSKDAAFLGTEGSSGLLYLVDPRIVAGTQWITGANALGQHVFGLVAERDFSWDGVVEAVAVREGDPAPDGSGPLEIARSIEVGQIFQLGRKYAEILDLKVLDQNGKAVVVTMGSYGIGISRILAAIAEQNHDDQGLVWPSAVAPALVQVIAIGKEDSVYQAAEKVAMELDDQGIDVIFDDRAKLSPGVKLRDAELLGMPILLEVGRGLADGVVEVKNRRTSEVQKVAVDQVASVVKDLVGQID